MAEGGDNSNSIANEFDLIRSVLRSDDHLQIQPSGDYEQARIKLDHEVQLSFFFDALKLTNQSLTIGNVHDFRISKSSKCPLTNEQWTELRKLVDDLPEKSDKNTSIYSIVQLVQDQLLQTRVFNGKYKPKTKQNSSTTVEDTSTANNKFRGADLIFNRILHDKSINRAQVIIGYEDRFSGMHEIAFNEFKKVHDDRYGVPMHRIRYYKINGQTVWDRTSKLDILTGSEQQQQQDEMLNDLLPKVPVNAGLYQFDLNLQQWTQQPDIPLTSDDHKTPSTDETTLPERCQFLTWNVLFDYHFSALIHTNQRYPAILERLQSLLPDFVCLQEVTYKFAELLFQQTWLQENNYSILTMQSAIQNTKENSYGQMILMKNFRPRAFAICPLDMTADESNRKRKTTKEILITRFDLSTRVTIDIVNVHLHSDLSPEASQKRCRTLENLFQQMNTKNYMIIGDMNFGDHATDECDLLKKYADDVHDLWQKTYDLEQEPGFTFDPSQNQCAQITSVSQIKRRLDRYLIHTIHNLYYSVQRLNMIGLETISINDEQHIHLSDHYALQLMIEFHPRTISHRSAFVILPTKDRWDLIEPFREQFDPSFNRWPPHFNLLWPFYDLTDSQNDEETILLPLRMLLCNYQAFQLEITEIDRFIENNICFMKMDDRSREYLTQIYEQLKRLFPQCCANSRNKFNPHMTIAQFENENQRKQAESSSLVLKNTFDFPVSYFYILSRPHDNDTTPFRITHQLPIGSRLPSIHFNQSNSIDVKIQEFFHKFDLYEDEQIYKQKHDTFNKLATCFQELFNKDTLHCFSHEFLPFGSFRYGIKGNDIDTVFVLNELSSDECVWTTLDETLLQMKRDRNQMNKYVLDLLENHINERLKTEIKSCRTVAALFSIISILFNDETKVEIIVQIRNSQEEIRGLHGNERLIIYARYPIIFQHLTSFIRTWAQHVGLYGQSYGYLSGYTWAVLCAHICHSSIISIEDFSLDQFFDLVEKFFSTYAKFPWINQSLDFHGNSLKGVKEVLNRGAMRISSPCPPYNNTARVTFVSTRDLIVQGFQHVVDLLVEIDTSTTDGKIHAMQKILELENEFPMKKVQSLLELTLSSANPSELEEWIGWLRSRLAFFLNTCEERCRLSFQTQNTVEYRANHTEAVYSIGFFVDEKSLNQNQKFSNALKQFLEQFTLYPNLQESMKISHQIRSTFDWKLERTQPKSQRIRK